MVTFYESVTTPVCRRALDILRRESFIRNFYLARGTALALQIGHRISTDLDRSSTDYRLLAPDREAICLALKHRGQFEVVSEQDGMLFTRLLGADVSFVHAATDAPDIDTSALGRRAHLL